MVLAAGCDRLVARSATTDLDPGDDSGAGEQVERPVDARGAYRSASPAEPVGDLLCAHAAGLGGEQLDHRRPRPTAAMAGLVEGGVRELRPFGAVPSASSRG